MLNEQQTKAELQRGKQNLRRLQQLVPSEIVQDLSISAKSASRNERRRMQKQQRHEWKKVAGILLIGIIADAYIHIVGAESLVKDFSFGELLFSATVDMLSLILLNFVASPYPKMLPREAAYISKIYHLQLGALLIHLAFILPILLSLGIEGAIWVDIEYKALIVETWIYQPIVGLITLLQFLLLGAGGYGTYKRGRHNIQLHHGRG